MSWELAFQCVGCSHLLQPPLSALLGRRLKLRETLVTLPWPAQGLVFNMAAASILLPTALGTLLATFSHDVMTGGLGRALAWLLALFWSARLYRQLSLGKQLCAALGGRVWHLVLIGIFCVQGPLLAALLAGCALLQGVP